MKKVLIVDDNKENKGIYDGREIEGIEFCVVNDELTTLRVLTDEVEKFDAILLDLSMPILDGFEIALQIRMNQKAHLIDQNLKIAFYSAWQMDNDILRMMHQAEIDRYFAKPIDPLVLAHEVQDWLQ